MGAYLRFSENRIERELERTKSKGVREGPGDGQLAGNGEAMLGAGPARDRRALIPPLGLREYWYPALPARTVGRKPLFWVMLGDELVLFRDQRGEVVALSDVCPHRGASMAEGDCFYRGFVTCPYHGATFDGQGECVAFLGEGPASKMVGNLPLRRYPTRTLRGWVFVWMGEGEPAPIEEDVPPEFFEPETTLLLSTYTYWYTNWMVAIENENDAHNCFFVHRNSVTQLFSSSGGRPRTPIGPRSKVVNGRALLHLGKNRGYYAGENGKLPYQMYYPGVDGVWPLHRWRLLWGWLFDRIRSRGQAEDVPEEWSGGYHAPSMIRSFGATYTRWVVPIKPNLSRVVYFHTRRIKNPARRAWEKVYFYAWFNWMRHYNFSGQDNGAASPCRYYTPEILSATDSHLVLLRKLITEGSRDAMLRKARADERAMVEETPAELSSYVRQEEFGLVPETELART